MSDLVKIHKDFNRSTVPFYQEKALELFTEITSRWNDSENFEPLIFSLSELKRALNLEGSKNNDYFKQFVLKFVKDTTVSFRIGEREITGNIFFISRNEKEDLFEVHMNPMLLEYMYSKKDVEIMTKAKKKEKMSIQELELFEKNKEKYQSLMLYSKAELQRISGKYNKRLYMLLVQFKKTGFFVMDYKQFKEVLEIPETYRQTNIDKRVLEPSKEELKKVGINIYNINKIKAGKEISKIEISFEYKTVIPEVKKELQKTKIDEIDEIFDKITVFEREKIPEEFVKIQKENLKKIRENLENLKK